MPAAQLKRSVMGKLGRLGCCSPQDVVEVLTSSHSPPGGLGSMWLDAVAVDADWY